MGSTKDKKLSAAAELRRQAEKQLRAKTAELGPPRTEDDAPRLLHELQVHQIELEMQNAELRLAQEELELSRNTYAELYDFAPVGYFTIDARGLIEGANLKGAHLLGIERGLLLKRPFISFIEDAADREIFSMYREEVFQKPGTQTCEIRLKRKYGAPFYAQLQSIAKESIAGKAGDILTAIIDIAEHKKAEEKIEHLASFPELNPNPVIETDLKEQVIFYNAATMKILKNLNAPEDVRLFLPRDLTEIIKKLGRENDGQYISREVEINGRVFAESITYYAYLKVVHIYAQDITERKRIEDAQLFLIKCSSRPSGEDFFISLARYLGETLEMDYVCIDRLLNDNLSAQTVAIYFDGKYEDNVTYTLKDTPCGDVVGKAICCFPRDVRKLFPNDAVLQEMNAESYTGVILWSSQGQPIGLIAVIGRKPLVNPKFAESILCLVAIPAAGELERRDAEEELKRRADQLEEANKELESFSYSVSHDLRSPLRAIDGYSRMILKKQADQFDEDTRSKFNLIRESARMMGQLIEDLLAFSRLGRAPLSTKKLDMTDLVSDVWNELQVTNPDRRIHFKAVNVPAGTVDRLLIKQVFVNILSNAIKFTRVRATALIEVGGYEKENERVYYVRDNGVGFDMQYHDKLFGVFQRLHSGDEYEGTGIGLALVQRIIHRHGGRVWAEGEVDKGATFYFTLPAGMEEASDKNQS
ncbi:MAG: ATP-binding protein [Syntrophales bacterium]|nr:ATP-binding protein [Syntrophales bacterium]